MSQMYSLLNQSYLEFLVNLRQAFAENKPLKMEQNFVLSLMNRRGEDTPQLYKRISPGFSSIVASIYAQDIKIFTRENNKEHVALFELTTLYNLVPHMKPQETETLWGVMTSFAQTICTLNGTARHMGTFDRIAKEFASKNADVDPSQIQKRLFTQLFRDRGMAKETKELFQKEDLSTMQEDMVHILSGYGFGNTAPTQKQTGSEPNIEVVDSDSEEDKKEEERPVEVHCVNPDTTTPSPPTDIFAKQKLMDAQIKKQVRKKRRERKNQSPFVNIMAQIQGTNLSDMKNVADMKDIAETVFGEDDGNVATREKREKVRDIFDLFASSGDTPVNVKDVTAKMQALAPSDDPESETKVQQFAEAMQQTMNKSSHLFQRQ